jgi:hypothetical protein
LIIENKKQLIALKKKIKKFSYKIAPLNSASFNGCLTYYILILTVFKDVRSIKSFIIFNL